MYKCSLGLGWNLSGGLRERVTPSQMRLASGSCHVRRNCCIVVAQPSESIMRLFKGACESKSPYYVMGLFGNPLRHATDFPWESFTNRPQRFQVQERL